MRRRGLIALGAALATAPAFAQTPAAWPERPVRIIVPFPPGGSTDVVTRLIAEGITGPLRQPVIVENRGGASGMIGAEAVARAAPDGHTLLMGSSGTHSINPSLFPNLPYDPVHHFAPVILTATYPLLMVTPPDRAPNTVQEFVAHARERAGRLNYCSIGNGQPSHLAAELFKAMAGIEMQHIPYRGSGPAILAAMAGECDVLFDSALSSGPQVRAGRLKVLAISTARRIPSWPDVPTIAESGLPGYDAYTWTALYAPAGTPEPVIRRLNEEVGRFIASPRFREALEAQGAVAGGGTPEELARFNANEIRKWAEVIRAGNIRPD
ncbi:Bug family tripartite tricarboxylate transporter substrate binding protein [Crenalkalicoccus roseus]|uniref:Bug family tripartite tricarboxylate transporter substrate binding protein n=1 Tax=Crenalkalicoccus roseus TaxID=1485588 RepID=UPI0010803BB1|nr:tripartite tricarboxylate transporter substrate binding protein [Crenalkalicoccus roseus]